LHPLGQVPLRYLWYNPLC